MIGTRVEEFDTWRPGYGLAEVRIVVPDSNTLVLAYTDAALTILADNPQTLLEQVVDGVSYGRFTTPLYVGVNYQLVINNLDRTATVRVPLYTLDDGDASAATVEPTGASVEQSLADLFARDVDVRDYGDWIAVGSPGASASTNNTTLSAAIGVIAGRGGGYVEIPSGTYQAMSFTLPQGVVLRGAGRDATILQSTVAGHVATIGGARSGFSRMTLDGVSKVSNSIGIYLRKLSEVVFDDFKIKRFAKGLDAKGHTNCDWSLLFISDCTDGYSSYGENEGGLGGAVGFNRWRSGAVELCTGVAIELKYVDLACQRQTFGGLALTDNGTALKVVGARATVLSHCQWSGNTFNLDVADATPATADNTVVGLEITDSLMDGGDIKLAGTLENVVFRRTDILNGSVDLISPKNNILVEDCRHPNLFLGGTSQAWTRHRAISRGSAFTVSSSVTSKAWELTLDPGQIVYLEVKVIGRGRNTIEYGFYHRRAQVRRPSSTLDYDTQTANFTLGEIVTGQTSAATGRIIADTDGGTTGSLGIQDVTGAFIDDEIITDALGGSATASGALTAQDVVVVDLGAITTDVEADSGWSVTIDANGPQVEVNVTASSGDVVEWTVDVDVVTNRVAIN